MTSAGHLRTAALRLAGVERHAGSGGEEFRVAGHWFARVVETDVEFAMDPAQAAATGRDLPAARVDGGVVAIALGELNGMQANALLGRAWAHRAPDAAPAAAASAVRAGDLPGIPRALGRPATAALAGHGIARLEDLAGRDRAEVAEWHGVGPKALAQLDAALAAAGAAWA